MSPRVLVILALFLAACGQPSVVGPKKAPTASDPAASPQPPAILSPQGWGPVRIGMTEARAIDAMGGAKPQPAEQSADCHYLRPATSDTILVMIESGKVSRIEARAPDATITDTGLSVGSTLAQVRARYSAELEDEPSKYDPAPAQYLTWWNRHDQQGIRYVIGGNALVDAIFVGGRSIRYVEGCS